MKKRFHLLKKDWHTIDKEKIRKAYENNLFTGNYELTLEGNKFISLYIKGKTYEEIANVFNMSRQNVHQKLKRIEKIINK